MFLILLKRVKCTVDTISVTRGLSKHKLCCEIVDSEFSMDAKPINYKAHLKPELNASCVYNENKLYVFSCAHKTVIVVA